MQGSGNEYIYIYVEKQMYIQNSFILKTTVAEQIQDSLKLLDIFKSKFIVGIWVMNFAHLRNSTEDYICFFF